MARPLEIEPALSRGLAFLEKNQEAGGGFTSYSSVSLQPFRRSRSTRTTFVPALMLAALSGLEQAAALRVRAGLAGFLLRQKDDTWAFNYWAKGAPERRAMPYPNDLDDTFCALAALYLHDPSIIDEAALATIIKLLLATEVSVGGPYRTWLVPADSAAAWLDTDLAVNSNVAYFLSLASNNLPALDGMMGRAIEDGSFVSPYYPSEHVFMYYLARAYGGPHKPRLLRKARQLYKSASTDLDRALCLIARLRLGDTRGIIKDIAGLLSGQRRDGSWPAAAFCRDPDQDGKPYYNGAAVLTTAFALEALHTYNGVQRTPARSIAAAPHGGTPYDSVLRLAKKHLRPLPGDLRRATLRSVTQLAEGGNGQEIIGLAGQFNRSLRRPLQPVPKGFLENLSLANLFGWAAYTIYDDFLDGEGQPGLLPAANVAMRSSLRQFLDALPADRPYHHVVRDVFDIIDGANAWELAHCRYRVQDDKLVIGSLPDYGGLAKLAERSFGHILAPLAILHASKAGKEAVGHTRGALQRYLIVRQLNDDLHDWQSDLEHGHITYVVARILSGLSLRRGRHPLPDLVRMARPEFWHETLPEICGEMRHHIDLGRKALDQAGIFTDNNVIGRLLESQAAIVADTIARQGQAENFLKHYEGKAVKL